MLPEQRYEILKLFTEKRNLTREDRNISKFKKKYNFVPDRPGSKTGTITVDGRKRKIDLKNTPLLVDIDNNRDLSTYTWTGEITTDSEFFKLKNQRRREAALQHEVGHGEMMNPASPTFNKKFQDYNSRMPAVNAAKKYGKMPKEGAEFEADRYSANRTSEKQLKRAMREYNKRKTTKKAVRRSIDANNCRNRIFKTPIESKSSKHVEKVMKDDKKFRHEAYLRRKKALNDKDLKNAKIYKEE